MTDRLALSIRQPWAWAIIAGHKLIENRSWKTSHRGRLFIHASQSVATVAADIDTIWQRHKLRVDREALRYGGLIGHVEIVDMIDEATLPFIDGRRDPWFVGPIGWVLASPTPIEFQPLRGAQGLFKC